MESQKTLLVSKDLFVTGEGKTIYLQPKIVLVIQFVAILILLSLNLLGLYLSIYTDVVFSKTHRLIDFNQEANIPTFYSALVIFVCSMILFLITALVKLSGAKYWGWLWLGFIFLFLSIDEAASIHEIFIGITRRTFNLSGYLSFAWVVPYGLAVIALAILYVPFLRDLPDPTRLLFLLSGAIFIAGAIGMEMIGGKVGDTVGSEGIYVLIYTVEELLEMLGMALFLYALLDYLSKGFDFNVQMGK